MANFVIRIELDQSEWFKYHYGAVYAIQDYDLFGFKQIEQYIRSMAFDTAVRGMVARAGPGWSQVYTDHLVHVLKTQVPIFGGGENGKIEVYFDLDDIGGYSELSRGAHHQALIDTGEFLIHPPKVELPYTTQALVSSKEKRQEFWENVIVDRDGSYQFGPRGQFTMADLGYVASYDEVAMARVLTWGNKAPEWLWLENGFNESKPEIYPVDFLRSIESISTCLASKLYNGALQAIINRYTGVGKSGKYAVGASGRPFEAATGRFVSYKGQLNTNLFGRFNPRECLGAFALGLEGE